MAKVEEFQVRQPTITIEHEEKQVLDKDSDILSFKSFSLKFSKQTSFKSFETGGERLDVFKTKSSSKKSAESPNDPIEAEELRKLEERLEKSIKAKLCPLIKQILYCNSALMQFVFFFLDLTETGLSLEECIKNPYVRQK